ncbi:uncharacterized protein PFL1_06572 [Pseudozyma flocculosa PF-1]|uniref:Uncharacterized protein n=2 Tax=Pseudozyma flocculosa TaxID=84751 RepID=A0A5C3F8M3_9BASI|nr:uncharacterized protein PFL1_06572 [Pseudozyma flocculosa PF-1]EPQ25899.1 hypothetical protein PFL1_06572 [Pseudozyma flocculosa PF-1]SPO40600.1 uncharacterized protein PSFLO_06082 [Pseudozyma flocculosa]
MADSSAPHPSRVLAGLRGDAIRLRLLSRLWNSATDRGASSSSSASSISNAAMPAALSPARMWRASLESSWSFVLLAASLILASLFAFYWFLRFNLSQGSSKQTNSLWQLSNDLNADSNISYGEVELDSDEYEAEAEADAAAGGKRPCYLGGHRARAGLRRLVGRDPTAGTFAAGIAAASKRSSSVIRIVSSDPTSNLCDNPLQLELEPQRRTLIPSGPFASPPAATASASSTEGMAAATSSSAAATTSTAAAATPARRSSSSGPPAPGRRRRESGRLSGAAAKGSAAIRSPSIDATRSGRSKQAGSDKAAASSPQLRPRQLPLLINVEGSARRKGSAKNASSTTADDEWTDEVVPEHEGGAAQGEDDASSMASPSVASNHSFVSASSGHRARGMAGRDASSPIPSPASSTVPLPGRMSSILKKEPQAFRSGLLSQIDISYSLVQRSASLANIHSPGGQQGADADQASAAGHAPPPPPYSAASPAASPLPPHAMSLPWLRRPSRQIKLIEPDWSEHAETHDRARERLETAAMVAASGRRSASFDLGLLHNSPLAGAGANGLGFVPGIGGGGVDDCGKDDDADEFWFERFTPSTAAAGRDWDWRKRRARNARNAALTAALEGQAEGVAGASALGGAQLDVDGLQPQNAPPPAVPGLVAKTDVQLQKGQDAGSHATIKRTASPRRQMPLAPLISFADDELPRRPSLTIDTSRDGGSDAQSARRTSSSGFLSPRRSSGSLVSPTEDSSQLSPRSKPRDDQSLSDPTAFLAFASAAGTGTLNSAIASAGATSPTSKRSGSATASLKRNVSKMMRRRTSANDAIQAHDSLGLTLIPAASMSDESLVESRRSLDDLTEPRTSIGSRRASDTAGPSPSPSSSSLSSARKVLNSSSSEGSIGSLSVPNRFSSLGRKVSLGELRGLRRGSSPLADLRQGSPGVELISSNEVPAGTPEAEREAYLALLGMSSGQGGSAPRSSADAYGVAPAREDGDRSGKTDAGVVSSGSPVAAELVGPSSSTTSPKRSRRSGSSSGSSVGGSSTADSGSIRQRAAAALTLSQVTEPHTDLRVDVSPARLKTYQRSAEEAMTSPSPLSPLGRESDNSSVGAMLAAASSSSPPVAKTKVRSGSRSSILKSAGGARNDLDRTSNRARRSSRTSSISSSSTSTTTGANGSIRRSAPHLRAPKRDTAPVPMLQPEPAPMGMAARARSASLSSNGSRSSSNASRRDALGALTSLDSALSSRFSSKCNTPDETSSRLGDPFGMTPMSPSFSSSSMASVLQTSASSPDLQRDGSRGGGGPGGAVDGKAKASTRPSSPPPNMPLPSLPVSSSSGGIEDDSVREAVERGERARKERRRRSGSHPQALVSPRSPHEQREPQQQSPRVGDPAGAADATTASASVMASSSSAPALAAGKQRRMSTSAPSSRAGPNGGDANGSGGKERLVGVL